MHASCDIILIEVLYTLCIYFLYKCNNFIKYFDTLSLDHSSIDDSATSGELSAGAIAGITIGCAVSLLIVNTLLIFACIYLMRHYKKKHSNYHPTTQDPPPRIVVADTASTTIASAPSPPSDYIPSQPPVVHYVAPHQTDSFTFVPSQSKDYPSKPPPEYVPEPPPPYPGKSPDYTPN